jgi:anti-sigma regulatory factor (Ser/Thr protein kinase)
MDGGAEQVQHFAPEPGSVPQARRFAMGIARPYLDARQAEALELAVSELVSNAVRHGGDPGAHIKLAITPKDGYMCVQVTDAGPGLVRKPGAEPPPARDDGGFGLFIVERLTRRWGVTREADRTRVWFEMDFAATATAAAA